MSLQVTPNPLAGLAAWFGGDGPGAGMAPGPNAPPAAGEAQATAAVQAAATPAAPPTAPGTPAVAAPPAWGHTEHGELSQPMPLAAAPASSPAPDLAAPPLTPAWVGSLQTPSAFAPGWPRAPRPEREARRPRPAVDDPWDDPEEPDTRPSGRPDEAPAARPAAPVPAGLPERVRAELRRRRSVLLLAPLRAATGPSPLAGWWLGVDAKGQARVRRCGLVGEAPAASGWRFWHAHRDDEHGAVRLATRADAPGQPALQLRLAGEALPPALRGPAEAWADLLEPGLARHCLGLQWTWLVACAPSPPPWA
ncbi:hypothetical protein EV684_101344 [Rubrivivax gelatinosus]|uniref:Uncharacterized protein n=1 Tax=Rubrivivax gelatinosus TaxID=28068 RepID=A0A4R2MF31_RUBGE|nr:hypothetical protein [Rubrivivax gelatinosus]TCP05472.1 hypothetical protein EV684_101344 [Rubrivivax gelatinosus]